MIFTIFGLLLAMISHALLVASSLPPRVARGKDFICRCANCTCLQFNSRWLLTLRDHICQCSGCFFSGNLLRNVSACRPYFSDVWL